MKGTTVTFNFDQTVADLRDLFHSEEYPADTDLAVARFTAERALRAYGCPDEQVRVIGDLIYWSACNVAHAAMNQALGREAFKMYDALTFAKQGGPKQVAA